MPTSEHPSSMPTVGPSVSRVIELIAPVPVIFASPKPRRQRLTLPCAKRAGDACDYDRPVRSLPTVLLVLSLPAGAVGYALAVQVLEAMGLADAAQGLVALFVPLFVAGLVMLPFLIPFFDRKAKADLAGIARARPPRARRPLLRGGTRRAVRRRTRWGGQDPMKTAIRRRYGPPADVVELRDSNARRRATTRCSSGSGRRPSTGPTSTRSSRDRASSACSSACGRRAIRASALDVAGVVEAVGAGVTRFTPGDEVFADLYPFGAGAFAEYVCAPERAFASMPPGMSFDEAATLPAFGDPRGPGPPPAQRSNRAAGRRGPDRRRIGQCRSVRHPGRQVDGRRGDRRLQHGQAGLRALARRRPRHRLHGRRLHGDRRPLRLDPRHRLAPSDPGVSAGRCDRAACT